MTSGSRSGATLLAAAFAIAVLGTGPTRANDLVRVGTPSADDFHFSMSNVGEELGIYKKYGIDLQITALAGGAKMHQALIANSLDVGLGAGTDLALIVKGATEKAVGVLAELPSNMVVQASTLSKITDVGGLKGKKIAVSSYGALTYWLAQQLAVHEGWGADGIQIVATGGGQANVAGFQSGSLDAAVTSLEAGMKVEAAGQGKILLRFDSLVNPFIAHIIYATNDMMAQHPDTLRRFLKGWYETVAWARANRAEAIKLSQKETELSNDLAPKIYDIEMPTFSADGHFDPKAIAAVEKAMLDLKSVDAIPDRKTLITEEFLK